MLNLIAIIENDSDMFITLDEDGEAILTSNIQEMTTFSSIEEARTFAKQMLDEDTCYSIVNVAISIKKEEIDVINY